MSEQALQPVAQGIVDADEAAYREMHRRYRALYKQVVEVARPMMNMQGRLIEAMLREAHPELSGITTRPAVIEQGDAVVMQVNVGFNEVRLLNSSEIAELNKEIMAYLERIG